MNHVKKIASFVYSKSAENFIISLIVINFLVLYLSTRDFSTEVVENIILFFFTLEIVLKLIARGWSDFKEDGWNFFDLTIVIVGIIPLIGIPLPNGMSGLRALRLLRLVRIVPALREIIDAIGRSLGKMTGVAGITVLFLLICSLMATLSFRESIPDLFGSFQLSLTTLLQLSAFDNVGSIVGRAWNTNYLGTLLVFPLFFASVPLLTLNMVIGILSNALAEEGESADVKEIKELKADVASLEETIKKMAEDQREILSILNAQRGG